jgi:hypothetical protein
VLSWKVGRLDALDWYVLSGLVAVTAMMFAPSEWYEHYAAFDGPFVVLAVALPVARLAAAARGRPAGLGPAPGAFTAATAAVVIAVLALASVGASARQRPARSYAAAGGIIPPGACVVTDTASATITAGRFIAASPGCPQLVDSVGTLIATTGGGDMTASRALLATDTSVWQAAFRTARYVWLIGNRGNTGARIAWTWELDRYFAGHFRLVAFGSRFPGRREVPRGGLYARKLRRPGNRSRWRTAW